MARRERLVIVDDDRAARELTGDYLRREGFDVWEAATMAAALAGAPRWAADCWLLDVRLPDGDGIEVCREVRSRHPEVACVMLTSFADDEALGAAVVAGASGYVLKDVRGNDLVEGIRTVATGGSLLDPARTQAVLDRLRRANREDELRSLTAQERNILDLMAEGLTNRQIGERLHLAEKTVKNYVSNVLAKMGMSRRTEAAVYAARLADRRRGDPAG